MKPLTPAEQLRKEQASAAREALELHLLRDLRAVGLDPQRQFKLPGREFRFDFAFPEQRVLCEVQGGTFSGGAHARGTGIERDCEKACFAAALGWRVMPVTGGQVKSGEALRWIEAALKYASP